jgi:hypothetical protein
MKTTFFLMASSKDQLRLEDGNLTAFPMCPGEMGVAHFESQIESNIHRRHCTKLKCDISFYNTMLQSHYINDLEYNRRVAKWCFSVEKFAAEWSPYRVPFDIRNLYTECNLAMGGPARIVFWPGAVPIQLGVDFF